MGVPKLFRWLIERYPLTSQPLPADGGAFNVDNLYLDMNNIIHPCFHPDDENGVVRTEPVIFMSIFNAIDRLMDLVTPQRLLYLAVDGVAPKAKVNQQRARRFQSAASRESSGNPHNLPDSNCITPGTEFMKRLATHLRYYVYHQVTEDPRWRNLQVIVSGPDVPGEGEHKIMAYMRWARTQPNYDPNTRHCLYGADADLMLLGLLSYEPHLVVLREVFRRNPSRNNALDRKDYAVVHLNILRDYLVIEFGPYIAAIKETAPSESSSFPVYRLVDDIVSLSCLVGNDFLPNFPSLYIPNNSIDAIWKAYGAALRETQGREFIIASDGSINWMHLRRVLLNLSTQEETYFRGNDEHPPEANGTSLTSSFSKSHIGGGQRSRVRENPNRDKRQFADARLMQRDDNGANEATIPLSRSQSVLWVILRNFAYTSSPIVQLPTLSSADQDWVIHLADELNFEVHKTIASDGQIQLTLEKDQEDSCFSALGVYEVFKQYTPHTDIKSDWALQYYLQKFSGTAVVNDQQSESIGCEWLKGFQWVLRYYRERVPSWTWSYNYHYAPLLQDAVRACAVLARSPVSFADVDEGPLKPFEQLLSVLPTYSAQLVPKAYQPLLLESTSPICSYYPRDFFTDLNGKINSYEAVVLIPFVDTMVLRKAMEPLNERLTDEERLRNQWGHSYLVTYSSEQRVSMPEGVDTELHTIAEATARVETLEKDYDTDSPINGALQGAKMGQEGPDQMGALFSVPKLEGKLKHLGLAPFGRPSSNASVALTVPASPFDNPADQQAGRKAAAFYLDRLKGHARGFWPCLEHVRIVALSNGEGIYYVSRTHPPSDTHVLGSVFATGSDGTDQEHLLCMHPHTAKSREEWRKSQTQLLKHSIKRHGVFLDENTSILAHLQRLSQVARSTSTVAFESDHTDDLDLPSAKDNTLDFEQEAEEREIDEDNTVLGVSAQLDIGQLDQQNFSLNNTIAQPLALLFPFTWPESYIASIELESLRRTMQLKALEPRYKRRSVVDARSRWSDQWMAARVIGSETETCEDGRTLQVTYTVCFHDGLWIEHHVDEAHLRPGTLMPYASVTTMSDSELAQATQDVLVLPTSQTVDIVTGEARQPGKPYVEPLPRPINIEETPLPEVADTEWTYSEYTGMLVDMLGEAKPLQANSQGGYDCPLECSLGPFGDSMRLLGHLKKVHSSHGYRHRGTVTITNAETKKTTELSSQTAHAVALSNDSSTDNKTQTQTATDKLTPSSPPRSSFASSDVRLLNTDKKVPPALKWSPAASTSTTTRTLGSHISTVGAITYHEHTRIPKSYIAKGAKAVMLRRRRPPNESFYICPFETQHLVPIHSMNKHLNNCHFDDSKVWKVDDKERMFCHINATAADIAEERNSMDDYDAWEASDEYGQKFIERRYAKSKKQQQSQPTPRPHVSEPVQRSKYATTSVPAPDADQWYSLASQSSTGAAQHQDADFYSSVASSDEPDPPSTRTQPASTFVSMTPDESIWEAVPKQTPAAILGQSMRRETTTDYGTAAGSTVASTDYHTATAAPAVVTMGRGTGRGRGRGAGANKPAVVPSTSYPTPPLVYPSPQESTPVGRYGAAGYAPHAAPVYHAPSVYSSTSNSSMAYGGGWETPAQPSYQAPTPSAYPSTAYGYQNTLQPSLGSTYPTAQTPYGTVQPAQPLYPTSPPIASVQHTHTMASMGVMGYHPSNAPAWSNAYAPRNVHEWLMNIGMSQYTNLFISNGFDDIRFIAQMSDEEVRGLFDAIGVPVGHRMQFVRHINELRRDIAH